MLDPGKIAVTLPTDAGLPASMSRLALMRARNHLWEANQAPTEGTYRRAKYRDAARSLRRAAHYLAKIGEPQT
jgi:hypothetical protein